MPITIKSTELKYKNPSTGQYQGIDAVAETTTSQQCALIEAKGAETIASIPSDYTTLSDTVDDLTSDVSDLNGALTFQKVDKLIPKGSKVSIIGTSISTYSGYIPTGYETYYPYGDVTNVNDTWWKKLLDSLGATLEINASYAGSRVLTYSTIPNFYTRASTNILGSPNVIIVEMGQNDSNASVNMGAYDFETAYTSLSETYFIQAYTKGMEALQALYPNAQIIAVLTKLKAKYASAILYICQRLGIPVVDCMTYDGATHPTKQGMTDMYNTIVAEGDITIPQLVSTGGQVTIDDTHLSQPSTATWTQNGSIVSVTMSNVRTIDTFTNVVIASDLPPNAVAGQHQVYNRWNASTEQFVLVVDQIGRLQMNANAVYSGNGLNLVYVYQTPNYIKVPNPAT